jgi:murein L,D-transpeptidase YcbB/YkuD
MFPNPHDVYLHDTPSRMDFTRAQRAFSSGCVRLERPLDLAVALLDDHDDWDANRMDAVLRAGEPQTVWLADPVPVHLLYFTAWAEPNGTIHFRPDIYNRDPALATALDASLPVSAPLR